LSACVTDSVNTGIEVQLSSGETVGQYRLPCFELR
jgi:hypothetical protein